jgi:hypothetical protein
MRNTTQNHTNHQILMKFPSHYFYKLQRSSSHIFSAKYENPCKKNYANYKILQLHYLTPHHACNILKFDTKNERTCVELRLTVIARGANKQHRHLLLHSFFCRLAGFGNDIMGRSLNHHFLFADGCQIRNISVCGFLTYSVTSGKLMLNFLFKRRR